MALELRTALVWHMALESHTGLGLHTVQEQRTALVWHMAPESHTGLGLHKALVQEQRTALVWYMAPESRTGLHMAPVWRKALEQKLRTVQGQELNMAPERTVLELRRELGQHTAPVWHTGLEMRMAPV